MASRMAVTRGGLSLCAALLFAQLLTSNSERSWKIDARTKDDAIEQALKLQGGVGFSLQTPQGEERLKVQFEDWMSYYNKTYNSTRDKSIAYANFRAAMIEVVQTNMDITRPDWATGNEYADLSWGDFQGRVLMLDPGVSEDGLDITNHSTGAVDIKDWGLNFGGRRLQQGLLPSVVDWRLEGAVSPPRQQGACGSCWAFAAAAAIESAYLITHPGTPPSLDLSEQHLVACVNARTGYGSQGCNGGWSDEVFNYVAKHNLTTEAKYPYTATTTLCDNILLSRTREGQVVQSVGGSSRVAPNRNERALMQVVAQQPVVAYFSADRAFQLYGGGVFPATTCTSAINHAVLVVGYSLIGLTPYWIVKNSWGTEWGEGGYARVAMTGDGAGPCGMYLFAFYPSMEFKQSLTTIPTSSPPRPPPPPVPPPPPPPTTAPFPMDPSYPYYPPAPNHPDYPPPRAKRSPPPPKRKRPPPPPPFVMDSPPPPPPPFIVESPPPPPTPPSPPPTPPHPSPPSPSPPSPSPPPPHFPGTRFPPPSPRSPPPPPPPSPPAPPLGLRPSPPFAPGTRFPPPAGHNICPRTPRCGDGICDGWAGENCRTCLTDCPGLLIPGFEGQFCCGDLSTRCGHAWCTLATQCFMSCM